MHWRDATEKKPQPMRAHCVCVRKIPHHPRTVPVLMYVVAMNSGPPFYGVLYRAREKEEAVESTSPWARVPPGEVEEEAMPLPSSHCNARMGTLK